MGLCFDCRSETVVNGGKRRRWQYVTVQGECETCGAEYSHELEFDERDR